MGKKARYRPLLLRVGPTLALIAVAVATESLGIGDPLDRRIHDAFVRLAPATPLPVPSELPDAAVVAIDPRSLRAVAPWPWPRSVHAEAVERLASAGASAIAFDIDFSSPSQPDDDARFAAALEAHGRVVLAAFSQTEILESGVALEVANRPIPALEDAAGALGSVLVPIDPDGVVRHAPRSSAIHGDALPSLARATLVVAAPPGSREAIRDAAGTAGPTRVDFRRTRPGIPRISYVDLIEDRFDPALVAGRAVFIGATAAEFQDLWATPSGPAMPGVMIQALAYRTAAAEATGARVLRRPDALACALGLLALGLVTLPRARQSAGARAALFAGAGSAVLGAGWLGLWGWGVLPMTTIPLALLAAQYTLGIETLQRRIGRQADAQESSLAALAKLGDATSDAPAAAAEVGGDEQGSLALALSLLGDVVGARGVVLLRATTHHGLRDERLEWWPDGCPDAALDVDPARAACALEERRTLQEVVPEAGAEAVYAPLVAGTEPIGVLVVFRSADAPLDALHRRTIATVGAQLALTAQNLQLIERLRETFESSIAAVASAVEARDGYTDQHCRRLAAFSSLMGRRLGMPEDEIRAMELGALLHDVGKIGVPDAILNKPGRLTDEERREMQRHPEIGAGIVAPVVGLEPTTLHCVVHHHERWDGEGYPAGLAGDEIPLAARIVSIVDVWDALSTARPYKAAYSQPEVRDRLLKGRGTQFDPELVDLFFEVLEDQGDEMLELVARSSSASRPE